MKKLMFILILGIVTMGLAGCTPNELGGFGPSWDVNVQVPIMEEQQKSVDELLADVPEDSGVVVPDTAGELIRIQPDLNNEDLPQLNLVEEVGSEISFPEFTKSVTLPELICPVGTISLSQDTFQFVGGVVGSSLSLDNLSFDFPFDRVIFTSNYADNRLEVTVTNDSSSAANIENLTLYLKDGQGNPIDSTTLEDYDSDGVISPGETGTGTFDLQGAELSENLQVSASITTSGTFSDEGTLQFDFAFPGDVEIEYIENFDPTGLDISQSIDMGSIDINTEIPAGLQEIAFVDGSSISVDVSGLPAELALTYDTFTISNLSDEDNDGTIDLVSTTPLDVSSGLSASLVATITDNDALITYQAGDQVTATVSFVNNGIDHITASITDELKTELGYDFQAGGIPVEEETLIDNLDLPDDLTKMDLYQEANPSVTLDIAGLEGLTLDLSNISFKAYDSQGQEVLDNGEPLVYNLGIIDGTSTTYNLLGSEPDLLDLLLHPDTSEIRVGGSFDVSGDNIVIQSDTIIGLNSVNIDIPISIEVSEDMEIPINPTVLEMEETISQEEMDLLKQGIKEASLVLEGLDNQLGFSLETDIYMATIENGEELSAEELRDRLYVDENMVESIALPSDTKDNLVITMTTEEAEVFTNNKVYFGVIARVPGSNEPYELRTGSYIAMDQIYAMITVKVNQFE